LEHQLLQLCSAFVSSFSLQSFLGLKFIFQNILLLPKKGFPLQSWLGWAFVVLSAVQSEMNIEYKIFI
jgi:hypothetical protein